MNISFLDDDYHYLETEPFQLNWNPPVWFTVGHWTGEYAVPTQAEYMVFNSTEVLMASEIDARVSGRSAPVTSSGGMILVPIPGQETIECSPTGKFRIMQF